MTGPQPAVPSRMRVGFNYPWSYNRMGGDIGPNPHVSLQQWSDEQHLEEQGLERNIPLPPLFDHIDRNLANLAGMGIEVVRYWIMANGLVYGQAPTHSWPDLTPLGPWDFSPPTRTDRRFLYHFEELLKRFAKAGMHIIPSLISFEFGGIRGTPSPDDRAKGLAAGGRANIFTDATKRQTFINTILADFLTVSAPFQNSILAWEVINEPCWNVALFDVNGPKPQEVDSQNLNAFLRAATQLIESKGFASTIGHRFFGDLIPPPFQMMPYAPLVVTGNRPQFHYYRQSHLGVGDPPQIKGQNLFRSLSAVGPKPFLGEFDSSVNRFGEPWPELSGNDTTTTRLELLQNEGCELALLWPDLGGGKAPTAAAEQQHVVHDDPIKLLPQTRQEIVNFTGGKLPPANE
jgi:hypothetical protein